MSQGNEKIQVELHLPSHAKEVLLKVLRGPLNTLNVRSIDVDGDDLHLELWVCDGRFEYAYTSSLT